MELRVEVEHWMLSRRQWGPQRSCLSGRAISRSLSVGHQRKLVANQNELIKSLMIHQKPVGLAVQRLVVAGLHQVSCCSAESPRQQPRLGQGGLQRLNNVRSF